LKPCEQRIFIVLGLRATIDEDYSGNIKVVKLRELAGISRQSVYNAIWELKEKGWIWYDVYNLEEEASFGGTGKLYYKITEDFLSENILPSR